MNVKPAQIYSLFFTFIIFWWALAFYPSAPPAKTPEIDVKHTLQTQLNAHFLPAHLTILDRITLKQALSGDVALMVQLIAEWETDAKLLESHGHTSVKKLPESAFLRSQLLGRIFSTSELEEIQNAYRLKCVYDDTGKTIALNNPYQRFLPQTYVAASFLLALADPKQIVAIPKGLREETELYPLHLTSQIPLDIDPFHTEALYQARPEIAFVSHYSHPLTLETLRNQGVQLFTLNAIDSIPEIRGALMRVGNAINRPLEAELLTIFMESAMIAIDNRLLVLKIPKENMLYLNHYSHYTTPSSQTLTADLLDRLGAKNCLSPSLLSQHESEWAIPLSQEQIVQANPEFLIVSTSQKEKMQRFLFETPAFQSLTAIKNNKVFFVEETVQKSPSQFAVLAYFDLANALSSEKLNFVPTSNTQTLTSYP